MSCYPLIKEEAPPFWRCIDYKVKASRFKKAPELKVYDCVTEAGGLEDFGVGV
jgi:hypothetical protein